VQHVSIAGANKIGGPFLKGIIVNNTSIYQK
jgi:hypothetical protein